MESKVVVVSIIVRDEEAAAAVNELLHEYRQYIVGRMGIPYRQRNVSIISVVMDAPGEVASALSGKLAAWCDGKDADGEGVNQSCFPMAGAFQAPRSGLRGWLAGFRFFVFSGAFCRGWFSWAAHF